MTSIPDKQNGWELQSVYREDSHSGAPGKNLLVSFRKSLGGKWIEITLWGDAQEIQELLEEWLT